MKKILVLIFNAILLMCFACETSNKDSQTIKEIENEIATVNAICPQEVAKHVTLTSMKYQNNTVIYDYHIDVPEDKVDQVLEESSRNMENLKKGVIYMLKGEAEMSPKTKNFFNNLIVVGANLEYKYHADTQDLYSISISNSELRDAIQL